MTYKTERLSAELRALADGEGMISPSAAVEWARRHPSSLLYGQLNWDDADAAEQFRIGQVRRLIAVHLVDPENHRTYVSLSIDRVGSGGYRPIDAVLPRVDLREVMLNDALADLRRLQAKYQLLQELVSVWDAAAKVETAAERRKSSRRKAREVA